MRAVLQRAAVRFGDKLKKEHPFDIHGGALYK
jgi:hypothetical protein